MKSTQSKIMKVIIAIGMLFGTSGNSVVAAGATLPDPPAAPAGLVATASNAVVTLTWVPSNGATGFQRRGNRGFVYPRHFRRSRDTDLRGVGSRTQLPASVPGFADQRHVDQLWGGAGGNCSDLSFAVAFDNTVPKRFFGYRSSNNHFMKKKSHLQILFALLLATTVVGVAETSKPPLIHPINPQAYKEPIPVIQHSTWYGCEVDEFVLAGHKCKLVKPLNYAPGKPWIWRPEFFGAFDYADLDLLLKDGYPIAYMDMDDILGSAAAMELMDQFYDHLTSKYGFSPKTTLFGFSRGGLYSINWAARHPDRVACIYLDAPVCDFKSWPGGRGKGSGSPGEWERLKQVYGFKSDQEALDYKLNPIDNLKPLSEAKIPILSVCGDADTTVPYLENTAILKERYEKLGGPIQVILKSGCDHHPHSLSDPKPIVEFVLKNAVRRCDALQRKFLAGVWVQADENTSPPPAAASESKVIPPDLQPMIPVYDTRYRGRHDDLVVQARTQPIEVALYGDSLTQNFGGEIWAREMAPLKAGNFGISGNKVENLLWRLQNGELEAMKLKVAVVMIGTNNLGGVPKAVAGGIKLILQTIAKRQPQARILLLGVPPAGWKGTDAQRGSAKDINALLADFRKQNLCDAYLDWGGALLERDGSLSHRLSTDGWHYTPAGYEVYVKAVKPVLLQCLEMAPRTRMRP